MEFAEQEYLVKFIVVYFFILLSMIHLFLVKIYDCQKFRKTYNIIYLCDAFKSDVINH